MGELSTSNIQSRKIRQRDGDDDIEDKKLQIGGWPLECKRDVPWLVWGGFAKAKMILGAEQGLL